MCTSGNSFGCIFLVNIKDLMFLYVVYKNNNFFFRITRVRHRKTQFDYESKVEVEDTQNPELYFKRHVFNNMLDKAISFVSDCFEKIEEFNDTCGYLFIIKTNKSKEGLLKSYKGLHQTLSNQNKN